MYVQHSSDVWRDFPELVPGAVAARGIRREVSIDPRVEHFAHIATERLAASSEAGFPEIQAWRRVFSRMGLRPTQYRCASESLLRRFRKEGALPPIHPLIDICNAISIAFAIPVAVFDASRIADGVDVRYASGTERYLTFSGETEQPVVGEVIFADAAGQAHARRWTNRQSGLSAVRDTTSDILIVAEAMHESARTDVQNLIAAISDELHRSWSIASKTAILSQMSPRFEF